MDGDRLYRFGSFTFQPRTGCLTQAHKHIALTPKAADLLGVLLENSGELVTKQELMEQVWPNTFVQENSLTFHIRLIRRALAQEGEGREYIETFPKRGYRFTASVLTENAEQTRKAGDQRSFVDLSEASVDQRSLEPVAVARTRTRSSAVLILAFGVVAVALLAAAARSLSSPEIRISQVAGIRPLTKDGGTKELVGFLDSKHVIVRTPGGMVSTR